MTGTELGAEGKKPTGQAKLTNPEIIKSSLDAEDGIE